LRTKLLDSFNPRGNFAYDIDDLLHAWQRRDDHKLHFLSGTSGQRLMFYGEERSVYYPRNCDYADRYNRFTELYDDHTIHL